MNNPLHRDWPLILTYHSISDTRADGLAVRVGNFQDQMQWLKRQHYRSITLADFVSQSYRRDQRLVIITFDDGYADNYWEAFPILKEYGFVATVFLVSDYVNTPRIFPWDQHLVEERGDPLPYRVLSWDQVLQMHAYGMEFGSHTCTHPELASIPPDQQQDEITRSRADLEAALNGPVRAFCYPRGDIDGAVIEQVKRAGYDCAVVTPPRAGIPLTRYTLRRVGVYHANSRWVFRLKVTRFMGRHREDLLRLRQAFPGNRRQLS
jgi:peptidoglycan/xylan/chitin deacetylase (PgdA/CDA1 family)